VDYLFLVVVMLHLQLKKLKDPSKSSKVGDDDEVLDDDDYFRRGRRQAPMIGFSW